MKVKVPGPAVQLCECMKRIYNQDMTSLTGGNLSVLDEEGVIWVTPSGIDKGGLCPEDIVRILLSVFCGWAGEWYVSYLSLAVWQGGADF